MASDTFSSSSSPSLGLGEITIVPTTGLIGSKDKNVGWFDKTTPDLQPASLELLELYSGVSADKAVEHVLGIINMMPKRDQAWEIKAYPCIGQFRFLDLSLVRLEIYPRLLQQLKSGGKLLDIGCCLAQDIRKLVFDGVPAENLYGAEYEAPFINVGYDLFRDRNTLKSQFMQADVLDDDPEAPLNKLRGSMDIIHLGMVLHVFNRVEQLAALLRCIEILKPGPGALIIGQAVGHVQGKLSPSQGGKFHFMHSDKTFRELISDLEDKSGAKFRVKAELDQGLGIQDGKRRWDRDDNSRRLTFEVERTI